MGELITTPKRWPIVNAAIKGLLRHAEQPTHRIVITDDSVSLRGQDNVEIGHIDLSSEYTHPAWIRQPNDECPSVHIDLAAE